MGNSNSPNSQTQSPHYTKIYELCQQLRTQINEKKVVEKCNFEKYFSFGKSSSSTTLAKLLFRYICIGFAKEERDCLEQDTFVKAIEHIINNGSCTTGKLQMYFRIFSSNQQSLTYQELLHMYQLCYQMYLHLIGMDASDVDTVTTNTGGLDLDDMLTQSMMIDASVSVSIEKCIEWTAEHIPCLFNPIHSWLITLLLHGPSQLQISLPVPALISWPDHQNTLLDESLLWLLSWVLPKHYIPYKYDALYSGGGAEKPMLDRKWSILYNSIIHGQSYNRFKHHCFSYNGPTVLLMSIESGPIIIAGIDSNWKEASSSWGNGNCILLQIQQKLQLLYEGENIVFLNERVRGLPTGMLFGSNYRKPLITIGIDLMSATLHYKYDTATHNITRMEVWGCAGHVAKEKQKEHQKWERQQAEKLQKVKLPGKWDENPDRALLEMAGVTKNYSQYGPGD